ncbi:uncharacterized transmembrane protein DDB_G0289901-like [Amphibalanus amphitrite]|uniref:uncharacterized transmembrane protein DDB_G0289901-like n=1 Tax=Amphibalanus amphitrite TaxID=1232801 RepID=UPI001C9032C2|nr:uncharacterized transmembrane protein DDB_G0289901-like [Amphibalanus amphitrite]XP_043228160.1 uncharacterized transmembrane protein DDB_G0289901-like [Amphibalanus amphitrite]
MRSVAIVLLLAAAAAGRPSRLNLFGGSFGHHQFQSPAGQATGSAGGTVTTGVSNTPLGSTSITNVGASAGGSAGGGNAVSTNTATATHVGTSGVFGNTQGSNVNAVSNQHTFGSAGSNLHGTFGGFGFGK